MLFRSHQVQQNRFVLIWIPIIPNTIQSVWYLYKAACDEAGLRALALNTFCTLWRNTLPFITVMKPMTDLCSVCQQNSTALVRAANTPDEEKTEVVRVSMLKYFKYLLQNSACETCRGALDLGNESPQLYAWTSRPLQAGNKKDVH